MQHKANPDRSQTAAYPLRLPQPLKAHLMQSASQNQRSLNGEIVFRLEQSRTQQLSNQPQKGQQ
ncbi:Arc family DNA-binding protein [Curvibacter sp. HBC61]|uniref:Arc family DNA-binding protein n=1 Tax=Curvibacter cyanobacteriorum TaxID=3026422 RepID=A0ABT5MV63_9BURK|nr:Arc family DNA-binding protein [Curvibacter sp. HBC61]MDD0837925.1 Arc family DNA-binding protein [Curvibacter sp. HBC61]